MHMFCGMFDSHQNNTFSLLAECDRSEQLQAAQTLYLSCIFFKTVNFATNNSDINIATHITAFEMNLGDFFSISLSQKHMFIVN